jgi:hypothetical protein
MVRRPLRESVLRQLVITGLGAAVALVGVVACGRDDGDGGESFPSEATAEATAEPTPEPEVQSTADTDSDVPECYPDDAPAPEGAVLSSIGFSDDDIVLCLLTVEVGELAPAMDGYRADLVAAGWVLGFESTGATDRAFGVAKGDVGIAVAGNADGGTSEMTITVGPPQLGGNTQSPIPTNESGGL